MNDDPWTNIDESGSEIIAETVAFSDYGDNRSANGSSSAYVNSPIDSPSGSVTYDPHADDTEDEEEVSVDSGRRPWVPPADDNHGFDPSSAILAALQESEFPPQMFDFSALAKSVHGERTENADANQMSQEKTGSLWSDSALRQPPAVVEHAKYIETDRISQASQSRQGDPASLRKPPVGFRPGHGVGDAEIVQTDRMSQASRGSRGKPPSLWRPSPSLHRPDEILPMTNSMARSAQVQSASPSVASSRPALQRQVDVSTQTEVNSLMPSVTAKTARIMDWIPDTQLGRVGYILDSLEDELRGKDQPIASRLASELKRLWYSESPREPTQPAQPLSNEIPAQVSMTPSVVVEERDSNPPSVVSQQEQRPSSKSPPPPDRTIANSLRVHDTSIDDEIKPRPAEAMVTHKGPSVIDDSPVKDTEKRWFDAAEWEDMVTQLTSKMIKSTFEALQPTVQGYVQQYLKDVRPAEVDPPLVEYLDDAAVRSLQRDPIVDDTHRRSNARSPPRGSTVNDTYYEPRERYEQDSRYTEYDDEPSPIARSQHFRQGPPDTRRYDTPEPSYQHPSTEAEYAASGSRYTSWSQKEVRWADTTRDSERTHPPAQRDFDDWMPRSSVPRSRNGMRIKFTQNGPRTRGSRREPQVGGYDRFELKTEVPESRRQRSGRFQGGFNRGRRW